MNVHVYILKLKSGRLYVGQSTDPRRRFFEHQAGTGANICKQDRPLEIALSIDLGTADPKLAKYFEDCITIGCMHSFSPMLVYGGAYCNEQYRYASLEWIYREIYRLNDWWDRLSNNRPEFDRNGIATKFVNWLEEQHKKNKQNVEG